MDKLLHPRRYKLVLSRIVGRSVASSERGTLRYGCFAVQLLVPPEFPAQWTVATGITDETKKKNRFIFILCHSEQQQQLLVTGLYLVEIHPSTPWCCWCCWGRSGLPPMAVYGSTLTNVLPHILTLVFLQFMLSEKGGKICWKLCSILWTFLNDPSCRIYWISFLRKFRKIRFCKN